jgi:hypothetical protein
MYVNKKVRGKIVIKIFLNICNINWLNLYSADKDYIIRVNSVNPAFVSTGMTRSEADQLGTIKKEYMEGAI